MIPREISRRIVTISTDPRAQGGIAAVVGVYAGMFEAFHHVSTTGDWSAARKTLSLLAAFPKLFWLRLSGVKIAHIHSASHNSFRRKAILIHWCRMLGMHVIFHLHGGEFRVFSERYGRDRVKAVLRRCDCAAALSEFWCNFLRKTFGIEVFQVNNVIQFHEPDPPRADDGTLHLLFLGHINAEKGIYDLLETMAADHGYYRKHVRLAIGGSGEDGKLKDMIARLRLDDIVEFHGWAAGEAKERLFHNADVFVLPSYIEGLPISILEAMSRSMPILSTPIGGIPSIVQDGRNGLLVQPGDKPGLDEAVKTLAGNAALRAAMGKASYQAARPYFTDAVEQQLLQIYRHILGEGKK